MQRTLSNLIARSTIQNFLSKVSNQYPIIKPNLLDILVGGVEEVDGAHEQVVFGISLAERASQTSSISRVKTDLVGFMKAGLAIVVDEVAAAQLVERIFIQWKEDFIHAART